MDKIYNVKLTFPFDWPLFRQTSEAQGVWGNYKFHLNNDIKECEFWIIFTDYKLQKETSYCPSENVIFLPTEPHSVEKFGKNFLKQFGLIITCQKEILNLNVKYGLEGHPWFVNKSYDDLVRMNPIKKDKQISLITSNKIITDGHKRRLDFALKLKDYLKDDIDLFGRGINNFGDKWEVLAPYRYSVSIENSYYNDYLTEKFFDCHLAFTYPLYYGCPNAENYFNDKAFSRIDINNFNYSIRKIEEILNNPNHYDQHLKYLEAERLKVLNVYNLFPLLVSYMNNMNGDAAKRNVTIRPQLSLRKYLSSFKNLMYK